MKKYIFTAILFASVLTLQAQSNKKGTFYAGLNIGAEALAGPFRHTYSHTNVRNFNILFGNGLGLRAGCGIAKKLSIGASISKKWLGSEDMKLSLATIGVEGKYYPINKDKFNLYISPSVAYLLGKEKSLFNDMDDENIKITGLNYGICAGFNKYWSQYIGMFFEIGYTHLDLDFEDHRVYNILRSSVSYNGIVFNTGIIAKFGGK